MRIEVDPSAANDPDAHRWLDRILHKIEDGWHVWDTAGQDVPNELKDTAWIRDSGKHVREMLVASIQRAAWTLEPHGRSVRVTTSPSTPDELTPEDATRLAEEPLCILVENRFSDGAFVRRVVKELDESLHRLWGSPGKPVRIDSPGGTGQMSRVVEHRAQGTPHRPRLVAIVDSDRRAPDGPPSRDARNLCRICVQRNLPCWILAKREAENYLPRILLSARQDTGADHRQLVDAWNRLTDDQKNLFDMKGGLPATLSAAERKLFNGLSPADRDTLSNGFGPKVHECWTLWNVQAKQELVIRGQGDLERGIALIRSET